MAWLETLKELASSTAAERLSGGVAGALVAAYLTNGTFLSRVAFGAVSAACSYHGSILLEHILPFAANKGLIGVYGAASALFGLTIAGRILLALSKWDASPGVQRVAERLLGRIHVDKSEGPKP